MCVADTNKIAVGGSMRRTADSNFIPYIFILTVSTSGVSDLKGSYITTSSSTVFYSIDLIKEVKSSTFKGILAFATPRNNQYVQLKGNEEANLWIQIKDYDLANLK